MTLQRRTSAAAFGQNRPESDLPQHTETGQRIYWALAYDCTGVDSYNTTVERSALNAMQPGTFAVLAHHDTGNWPVAKAVQVDHSDHRGPWVGLTFAETPEGRLAEYFVREDFGVGVSIGFLVPDEDDAISERADGVLVFHKLDVRELSLTPVPSSKGAQFDLSRAAEFVRSLAAPVKQDDAPVAEAEPVVEADTDAPAQTDEPAPQGENENESDVATVADEHGRALRRLAQLKRISR